MTKTCTKCGSSGPFHRDRSKPDGFDYRCKLCKNEASRKRRAEHLDLVREKGRKESAKYRKLNPDKIGERGRKYRESNREKIYEFLRGWREDHREESREYSRQWRKDNPEKMRDSNHRWRVANSDKVRENKREWYEANKDKVIESNKRWRDANPEKWSASQRKWNKNNPEKRYERKCRRRAAENGAQGNFMMQEWEFLQEEYAYHCAYCGCKPERLEPDHIVPISKGGTNDISNIVSTCKSCNCSKNNTPLLMWMYRRAQI